jgi:hypothetical protein
MDNSVSQKNLVLSKIEFHHHPFTLWDIVETVIRKHIEAFKEYNAFDVAEEVATMHYSFLVGLMPLSPGVHKLFDDGLFIHPDLAIGDWKIWAMHNMEYFSSEVQAKYDQILSDIKCKNKEEYPNELKEDVTYLQLDYKNDVKLLEEAGA